MTARTLRKHSTRRSLARVQSTSTNHLPPPPAAYNRQRQNRHRHSPLYVHSEHHFQAAAVCTALAARTAAVRLAVAEAGGALTEVVMATEVWAARSAMLHCTAHSQRHWTESVCSSCTRSTRRQLHGARSTHPRRGKARRMRHQSSSARQILRRYRARRGQTGRCTACRRRVGATRVGQAGQVLAVEEASRCPTIDRKSVR